MFANMKIMSKLILMFVIVGLLPVVGMGLYSYFTASDIITDQVYGQQGMFMDLVEEELTAFFEEREADARVAGATRDVYQSMNILAELDWDGDDRQWLQRRSDVVEPFGEQFANQYGYGMVFMASPDGEIVYSDRMDTIGASLADRDYFQAAVRGDANWSEVFYSDIIHDHTMVRAQPIYSQGVSGDIVGVLGLLTFAHDIEAIVHHGVEHLGESGDSYVLDERGILLTNTRLGEYTQDAVLEAQIETQASRWASEAIRAENPNFSAQGQYSDYLGNTVIGSVETVPIGDHLVAVVTEVDADEAFMQVTGLRNAILLAGLLVVLLGTAVALFIARSISKPTASMVEAIETAATGDLTVEAKVNSTDEIGAMGTAFNQMLSQLRDIVAQVSEASDNTSSRAGEVSSAVQETAASVEEVASTANQFASTVETTSSNSQGMAEMAQNTMEKTDEGAKQIQDTVSTMGAIHDNVNELSEEIAGLDSQSERIRSIVELITGIADQTNLLALNAAIEAARAGEHGRGFAVVADEVRKLAEQSGSAAGEITEVISEMRQVVESTVEKSKQSSERVIEGTSIVEATGEAFTDIQTTMKQLNDGVAEIATAAEELASGGEEIAASSQEQSASVEQIGASIQEVANTAHRLQELVGQFKV